jgi:hypothetical protein
VTTAADFIFALGKNDDVVAGGATTTEITEFRSDDGELALDVDAVSVLRDVGTAVADAAVVSGLSEDVSDTTKDRSEHETVLSGAIDADGTVANGNDVIVMVDTEEADATCATDARNGDVVEEPSGVNVAPLNGSAGVVAVEEDEVDARSTDICFVDVTDGDAVCRRATDKTVDVPMAD